MLRFKVPHVSSCEWLSGHGATITARSKCHGVCCFSRAAPQRHIHCMCSVSTHETPTVLSSSRSHLALEPCSALAATGRTVHDAYASADFASGSQDRKLCGRDSATDCLSRARDRQTRARASLASRRLRGISVSSIHESAAKVLELRSVDRLSDIAPFSKTRSICV